jgi:thiamine pyrophosphate-dependent acetolactate synthase large subunit-like protein
MARPAYRATGHAARRAGHHAGPAEPGQPRQRDRHRAAANAIIADEAATSGFGLPQALAGAPRHTLLALTGGAIGQGLPVAVGAAVAAPDRPVLAIEADGSSLYTIQALWTMAREKLNVTTVLVNNAAYAVLRIELARTGAGAAGRGPPGCSTCPTRSPTSPG